MRGRQPHQRPEGTGDLLGDGLVELAVHVVVVVVDEQEAAAVDPAPRRVALGIAETHRHVAREIREWIAEQIARCQRRDHAAGRDLEAGVARDGVDDVGRYQWRAVPVARFVLYRDEHEGAHGAALHAGRTAP